MSLTPHRKRAYFVRMRIALLLSLLLTVPALAQTHDPCAVGTLPTGVQELLKSKYHGLRPKTLSDLAEDDQKLWLASNPHSCPGVAVGAFEERSHRGYAILLVPKSGADGEYKLVVVTQHEASAEYHVSLLTHGSNTPNSGLVISRVPPGKQTGFDESKSVTLRRDGINLEWLEKGSVLYYYSSGRYRELQTSD